MATVTGGDVIADARRYLGIPYLFGGGPDNPRAGLDCSGLTERVAFDLGFDACPRTSELQFQWAPRIDSPTTGCLIFFVGAPEEAGPPGHVAFVVTPGTMIDAPHQGLDVSIQHYDPNGTGENAVMGYATFPGLVPSSSSSPSVAAASAAVGGGSVILFMFMIFVMILILALFIVVFFMIKA